MTGLMIVVTLLLYGGLMVYFGFVLGRVRWKESDQVMMPMMGNLKMEGRMAREAGLGRESCPYPVDSNLWWSWQDAWKEAVLKPGCRPTGKTMAEEMLEEYEQLTKGKSR